MNYSLKTFSVLKTLKPTLNTKNTNEYSIATTASKSQVDL